MGSNFVNPGDGIDSIVCRNASSLIAFWSGIVFFFFNLMLNYDVFAINFGNSVYLIVLNFCQNAFYLITFYHDICFFFYLDPNCDIFGINFGNPVNNIVPNVFENILSLVSFCYEIVWLFTFALLYMFVIFCVRIYGKF